MSGHCGLDERQKMMAPRKCSSSNSSGDAIVDGWHPKRLHQVLLQEQSISMKRANVSQRTRMKIVDEPFGP
jgi:hypothetical protein